MAKSPRLSALYDVHPSVAYVQAILANFKVKTGRTVADWVALARTQELAESKAPQAWLKAQGLGSTQASLVAQRAGARPGHAFDDSPDGYLASAPGYVDQQYRGRKAALRPLFDGLVALARGLGSDMKVSPCETIVPFYRNHVFAEVKAFALRLDLGLALGDPAILKDPSGRLKDTGGFKQKDRITHRLEITSLADLDSVVPAWLKQAYERDGS